MAMTSRVEIAEIARHASGPVMFQLNKIVAQDDGTVLFSEPHRGTIEPGMDAAHYLGLVNQHLNQMGFPAMPTDGVLTPADIVATVQAHHTPAFVAAYRARTNPPLPPVPARG